MLTDLTDLPPGPAYRCPACGDHSNLFGVAHANVRGRVLADGTIEEVEVDQYETRDDSIECGKHLMYPQRFVNGAWCLEFPCDHDGGSIYGCPHCKGNDGFRWVPCVDLTKPAPVSVSERSDER